MFSKFLSKPIVRKALQIQADDVLGKGSYGKLTLSREGHSSISFVAHEDVNVGDYIVHLNADDVYHCNAKVFAERNVLGTNNKVTFDKIQALMSKVRYTFSIVPETTTTVCTATLWINEIESFTLATEYSACVDPANFDKAIGERYAKERAEKSAIDNLWMLEGYALKKQMTQS